MNVGGIAQFSVFYSDCQWICAPVVKLILIVGGTVRLLRIAVVLSSVF